MARVVAVCVALLLGGCVSVPKLPEGYMPEPEWKFVCNSLEELGYTEVDCAKTPPPKLVISYIVEDMAAPNTVLYGLTYPGEDYIFVNPEFPDMWNSIAVHEATHYLLTQTYGMPSMQNRVSYCLSEEVARIVHHKYEGTEYDDGWRYSYGCVEEPNGD